MTTSMIDETLGRGSTALLALGIVPAAVVILIFVDGMMNPGTDHSRLAILSLVALPPAAAAMLGMANHRDVVHPVLFAIGAFAMIAVWYAVLLLPAVVVCGVVRGGACM
jgi:hypothetical protein